MNYDKDYFIRKFEAIPEENWCMNSYGIAGVHCAFGHCGSTLKKAKTDESIALASLLPENGTLINDRQNTFYPESTPKQRILGALRRLP